MRNKLLAGRGDLGYHSGALFRFIIYAVPLLVLELALFGFAVEILDVEPGSGSVIRLALLEQPQVPGQLVFGTWLVEASGLVALFLLTQGRFGTWWLDGLVAGWVAWIFRGPLLVITIVVAAGQPQDLWWTLAFGWWVLYSVCGLSLALLARRSGLDAWAPATEGEAAEADRQPGEPSREELTEPTEPVAETMDAPPASEEHSVVIAEPAGLPPEDAVEPESLDEELPPTDKVGIAVTAMARGETEKE